MVLQLNVTQSITRRGKERGRGRRDGALSFPPPPPPPRCSSLDRGGFFLFFRPLAARTHPPTNEGERANNFSQLMSPPRRLSPSPPRPAAAKEREMDDTSSAKRVSLTQPARPLDPALLREIALVAAAGGQKGERSSESWMAFSFSLSLSLVPFFSGSHSLYTFLGHARRR